MSERHLGLTQSGGRDPFICLSILYLDQTSVDNIRRDHDRIDTYCVIEFGLVMRCHDESFVILLVLHRLLFEHDHSADELLDAVWSLDDGVRFLEVA